MSLICGLCNTGILLIPPHMVVLEIRLSEDCIFSVFKIRSAGYML